VRFIRQRLIQDNVIEVAKLFGGPENLKDAMAELQALLYAA